MITRAKISAVRANSFAVVEQFIVFFLVIRNSSNKRRIGGAALINFYVPDAALIRVNTVCLLAFLNAREGGILRILHSDWLWEPGGIFLSCPPTRNPSPGWVSLCNYLKFPFFDTESVYIQTFSGKTDFYSKRGVEIEFK